MYRVRIEDGVLRPEGGPSTFLTDRDDTMTSFPEAAKKFHTLAQAQTAAGVFRTRHFNTRREWEVFIDEIKDEVEDDV